MYIKSYANWGVNGARWDDELEVLRFGFAVNSSTYDALASII